MGCRRGHGLVAGGYRSIDSLRLEKGYRVWGADISPEDTPYQAGLGFAVSLDKGDFVGRAALLAAREPDRLLRCLALSDPHAVALGSEPVRVGDGLLGRVTSGGYGYTVESSIAYAYLPAEHDVGTEVAVEIFGQWVDGVVAGEPLYDPAGERIRRDGERAERLVTISYKATLLRRRLWRRRDGRRRALDGRPALQQAVHGSGRAVLRRSRCSAAASPTTT